MRMLTKFESRSSRAKAVALHPTRSWVAVALYSSTIQLWDYRMGAVIGRFEGHRGPVRGLDIHPTQDLMVSCGDDQLLHLWSITEQRELYTLSGHGDYVRTCFFHKSLPWIVSASDDQTVRVWDWQSRREVAVLTGHNHWVACAVFHPTEDLILSSSLDTTVRAWDISALKRRYSAPDFLSESLPSFPGMPGSIPPLGHEDDYSHLTVKYILEGHDRGVTWVACHPTQPLIATASDDKTIKLWRVSGGVGWEIDTLRGHTDEVTSVVFHQNSIISCATDETVRVWDLETHALKQTYPRQRSKPDQADRYWQLCAHPRIDLLAAAYDTGSEVFKFGRERAVAVANPVMYVGRDLQLRSATGQAVAACDFAKFDFLKDTRPVELSYNPSEQAVVATFSSKPWDRGTYVLSALTSEKTFHGTGRQALFISRNRFCVLTEENRLQVFDMENKVTKELEAPIEVKRIAAAPQGHVLLISQTSVMLFDVQQGKEVATLTVPGVRYAVWSPNNANVALIAKHDITIATKKLVRVVSAAETIRVKSACWDAKLPVLLYSTFSHLKYMLLNGECGILRTLSETLYLASAVGTEVLALSRSCDVELLTIDPTELRFKLALLNGDFAEVGRLVHTSSLVGQNIVAYLQKQGYPEIALEFVEDPQTRLDLAVESGNLKVASEVAEQLQGPEFDAMLETAAMEQGNHDLLEDVYLRQRQFDKLAFVYLATGNRARLQRLEQLANQRGDAAAQFQASLYLGTPEARIELLKRAGMAPLAYALAKSSGLTDEAEQILLENGKTENEVKVSTGSLTTPRIVKETWKQNWPVKAAVSINILNLASLNLDEPRAADAAPVEEDEMEVEETDEWGLDDALEEVEVGEPVQEAGVLDAWTRSPLAVDHIAAGSFQTAFQLLHRQIGVVKFDVLKHRFLDVYQSSKLAMQGHDSMPVVPVYVFRDDENSLPFVPGFEQLQDKLAEAFNEVKANQLELAIESFRAILRTTATLAVKTEQEESQVRKTIETCRNYILAFSIEVARRALPADSVKRNLELAAYFTKPQLKTAHATLPLRVAVVQASNAKNYALASHFAAAYLKLDSSSATAERMRTNKSRWDSAKPVETVDIDFDTVAEFDIDPHTLTPIYSSQPSVTEPLTGAKYHAPHNGSVCAITGFTQVGAATTGLRLRA